jgi:hypothetical protein
MEVSVEGSARGNKCSLGTIYAGRNTTVNDIPPVVKAFTPVKHVCVLGDGVWLWELRNGSRICCAGDVGPTARVGIRIRSMGIFDG